jgi:hypothetical protein
MNKLYSWLYNRINTKKLLIDLIVAIIIGVLIGITYRYQDLFVTIEELKIVLILASLIIGFVSGWRSWFSIIVFLTTVAYLFFIRALIGRDLSWDYFFFAFSLVVGPVLKAVPYAFGAAYSAAAIRNTYIWLFRKTTKSSALK